MIYFIPCLDFFYIHCTFYSKLKTNAFNIKEVVLPYIG